MNAAHRLQTFKRLEFRIIGDSDNDFPDITSTLSEGVRSLNTVLAAQDEESGVAEVEAYVSPPPPPTSRHSVTRVLCNDVHHLGTKNESVQAQAHCCISSRTCVTWGIPLPEYVDATVISVLERRHFSPTTSTFPPALSVPDGRVLDQLGECGHG